MFNSLLSTSLFGKNLYWLVTSHLLILNMKNARISMCRSEVRTCTCSILVLKNSPELYIIISISSILQEQGPFLPFAVQEHLVGKKSNKSTNTYVHKISV